MCLTTLETTVLKITRITQQTTDTVRLDGRLTAAHCDELDRLHAEYRSRGQRVHLDLRGLSFADSSGVACLCRLLRDGATVSGASMFLDQLLQECRR